MMGDIAASPPRHEDFYTCLAILFQEQGVSASLGAARGSQYASRPGANHNHIVQLFAHAASNLLMSKKQVILWVLPPQNSRLRLQLWLHKPCR
jgi:hypothetical protein